MKDQVKKAPKHECFDRAVEWLKTQPCCSCSALMSQFNLGYNSAGMLVDELEDAQIIGPFEGAKARKILIQSTVSQPTEKREVLDKGKIMNLLKEANQSPIAFIEQKEVKCGFEKRLESYISRCNHLIEIGETEESKRTTKTCQDLAKMFLMDYLKHIPKQKEAETADQLLSDFITEIKKEFPDQNWDYLVFIKERVLLKAHGKGHVNA